jgi:hypothetical protein
MRPRSAKLIVFSAAAVVLLVSGAVAAWGVESEGTRVLIKFTSFFTESLYSKYRRE